MLPANSQLYQRKLALNDIKWPVVAAYIAIHISLLGVFWSGVNSIAVGIAAVSYFIRFFGITAGLHRYITHRAYKTSRVFQFILAALGMSAAQPFGPITWAAHHRYHHLFSDKPQDVHTPRSGFWWSHILWTYSYKVDASANYQLVRDLSRFPELRWLEKYHYIFPFLFFIATVGAGFLLQTYAPHLGTNALQIMIWGYVIPAAVLFHFEDAINSVAHRFGRRRYPTDDDSRNNALLGVLAFGEGWHNNHHWHPASVRQGFYWWEVDISYYVLWVLSKLRVVWGFQQIPVARREMRALTRDGLARKK